MPDNQNVLVIGANRGLGFEWSKQWLKKGARVFATARNPENASELQNLQRRSDGALSIHQVDVAFDESVQLLSDELGTVKIDVLIHNSGIMGKKGLDTLDTEEVLHTINVNAVGALRTARAFRTNLGQADGRGKIALITSLMGSIADNRSGGSYAYRMSKAALNMAGKSMAVDLTDEGIDVIILHPGWVKTDMGGAGARISVEESVSGMMRILDKLEASLSGTFWHSNGNELPW